jgi:hypothetical protein
MSHFFEVNFLKSAKGRQPIAVFRLNENECNTFYYAACGRKEKDLLYYSCLQCKKADGKVKDSKKIHLKGATVINGNPATGHKLGCKPLRAAAVHAEDYKRKASREVRAGISTVGNARLNNLTAMASSCKEVGVDVKESRKQWDSKAMNSRLNKNKTARVSPLTDAGDLPPSLKVSMNSVGWGRGVGAGPA